MHLVLDARLVRVHKCSWSSTLTKSAFIDALRPRPSVAPSQFFCMLRLGIVGLPNVGKSTLFNALTSAKALVANYPFATIEPNTGIVQVPDPRLDQLARIVKPERTVPAVVEFMDIAGLVKGASEGEGL